MPFEMREQRQNPGATDVLPEHDPAEDEAILDLPDRELMSVLPTVGWLGGGLLGGAVPTGAPEEPPLEETP